MKNIQYTLLFALLIIFSACSDFLDPEFNNNLSEETVLNYDINPEYMAGLYVPAYGAIPGSYTTFGGDFLDCATDNAVCNDYDSKAWKMFTVPEYYTSQNYPINIWGRNYKYIKDIYKFLEDGLNDDITYRTSTEERNVQIKKRMKGEAYFLLGLNYFQLLRDYAGPVNGEIMGVPIVDKYISVEEAKELSRDSYDDCVNFIAACIDTAIMSGGLISEYTTENSKALGLDATIYGNDATGLPTTVACYALKSRLYLYAASPAFTKDATKAKSYYQKAAEAAKAGIDAGNIDITAQKYWYDVATMDDYYTTVDFNPELILRRTTKTSNWEKDNYPPSLGLSVQGTTNPSQNLVDAFPMSDGLPMNDSPLYDANDPYKNRDPRFYMTVLYNDVDFRGQKIEMFPGGNNTVGAPGIADDSRVSRTNFYLRKWMTEKPSFITGVSSEVPWHFAAMFRVAELYLNFAEAANKAVGPDVAIGGLTAKQALRNIRYRAYIPEGAGTAVADDPYLNGLADISDLIKNERRIELCFEGHRFYDIRRWGDNMNTTVKKATIDFTADSTAYVYGNTNVYPTQVTLPEYMRYGAIPKSEIMVCENIKQNDGWK